MQPTCEIDMTKFIRSTESLSDALLGSGKDASEVLADETKRLSRQIMNFTPPMKQKAYSDESPPPPVAQKIGEMAIQRDLSKLFSEADTKLIDEVGSAHGTANISAFITTSGGQKMNLRWDALDAEGARMKEVHTAFLAGGRKTTRLKSNQHVWAARNVVPTGSIARLQAQLVTRVGRLKASFARIAIELGDRMPQWIAKHDVKNISVANKTDLYDKEKPSITFGSSAPGVGVTQIDVQKALNQRATNIAKRIKLILNGYKRDIGEGRKCQPRAKESNLT